MCGRTACTLAPDNIVRACSFRNRQGKYRRPVWKEAPGGQQYYPSHNIAPASHTPVLLSSKHFSSSDVEASCERVVQPMKWGLIPSWHKGDPYKLEYETNNCRAEGMLSKRTYKGPLEKGNRCVILADGFFEWKRTKEGKQPYFIYFPQDVNKDEKLPAKLDSKPPMKSEPTTQDQNSYTDIGLDIKPKMESLDTKLDNEEKSVTIKPDLDLLQHPKTVKTEKMDSEESEMKKTECSFENSDVCISRTAAGKSEGEEKSPLKSHLTGGMEDLDMGSEQEGEEWRGKRLLTMAGVFEVWHPSDGSQPMYSYSVITVESSTVMSGIHHRMPAILNTEDEINDWIDFADVPLSKAVKAIQAKDCVTMHMVSPVVNNSRNKSPQCVEPYNPKEIKKSASSNLMMNWLRKAKPSPEKQDQDCKKPKLE